MFIWLKRILINFGTEIVFKLELNYWSAINLNKSASNNKKCKKETIVNKIKDICKFCNQIFCKRNLKRHIYKCHLIITNQLDQRKCRYSCASCNILYDLKLKFLNTI